MKALIIAAGEGSRFQNLTKSMPKPLIEVSGISLIERIILTGKQAGITEFIVVIGCIGDKIQEKIGRGEKLGVKVSYVVNSEWKKKNGISVLKAKDLVNENFFLLMSDHLFDKEILKMMKSEKINNDEVLLAVDYNLDSTWVDKDDVTKVKVNNNKIINIGKEINEYDAYDTGIFLCSSAIFDSLEKSITKNDCSLSDGIRLLSKKGKAKVFDIGDYFWIDIDTPEYLQKAREIIKQKEKNGGNFFLQDDKKTTN